MTLDIMEIDDLEKEMRGMAVPSRAPPGRRLDLKVKNACFKIMVLRAAAFLFITALLGFSIYVVFNAGKASMDRNILVALLFILVAAGALVSLKLWNLEHAGWLYLLMICVSGVVLPAFSAFNHRSLAVGTMPIIAVSLVGFVMLWYAKDVLGIKKYSDIFNPR